ncbi:YhgE/Pip family protein [Levilactobacillus tangyuanensis]|uniref:YhgE/Pip family protein n=1 Tax=Levilactobacillus tangyuanensis TaxID=2486021 RepID=A0ABW1TRS9_9LACO|nr:YhgE/Pip domain-containing protein [Levilactobacillus tangyuanensis]
MIKGEWSYIRHNRLILISVIAIMFIPFLYSIFFLKSVWDPYGETGKLPVAVVNNDQAVSFKGQKLNVGDQTVSNLKKNHQLGWRFVSASKAADGLKHHKYYTVITIPKNFSANAATALDKTPKKMTFSYKTNGSANYIAQVMSEVGSDKLDSQIKAKVTKAYAQATFKQIYAVGQGMDKAAKGSAKLKDGTVTLTDGLNAYTTGVSQLNDGLLTMKTKVQPLSNGIQKLTDGSATLASGLGQYTSGVNQFTGGVSQLSAKMPTMQAGANKLNSGVYKYVNGVYSLNSGLGKLTTKVGPLASGVTKLSTGSNKLTSGLKELDKNSKDLNSGAKSVAGGVTDINALVTKLGPSLGALSTLTADPTKLDELRGLLQSLANNGDLNLTQNDVATLENGLKSLSGLNPADLSGLPTLQTAISTDIKNIEANKPSSSGSSSSTATSGSTTGSNSAEIKASQDAAAATKSDTADLQAAVKSGDDTAIKNATQQVARDATTADAKAGAVTAGKDTPAPAAANTGDSAYNAAVESLVSHVMELNTTLTGLTSKLNDIVALQTVAPKLVNLMPVLQSLSNSNLKPQDYSDVASALTQLQAQMPVLQQLGSSKDLIGKLSTGATKLSTGLDTYTAGVHSALDGSNQLTDGLTKLNKQVPALTAGVTQLSDGSKKLVKKSPSLTSGMSQLTSGINQAAVGVNKLQANTPKLTSAGNQLNQGASTLSAGLTTLNGKVPALVSGVNQAANGSQQLVDKNGQIISGANKLNKGQGQLATSLKSGAKQINDQPLSDKTADMFAAPTHLKHESYSYVPNYGHALAPYVLSVALYVGALVFNFAFPIRKVSKADGSATGWFFSKVSIGAVVALAMAVIEPSLMMLGGLSVVHPMQMILVSIMFSEASMFIVMFLSMLLDNPGRFLAMVLLMLQLGGSGGTFPMEVTNSFYNAVHPFLPMTYSILGFRDAITSGMPGMVGKAFWMLLLFMIVALALLWPTMIWLKKKHLMGVSQLDDNQKLGAVEDPNTNSHS